MDNRIIYFMLLHYKLLSFSRLDRYVPMLNLIKSRNFRSYRNTQAKEYWARETLENKTKTKPQNRSEVNRSIAII